MKMPILNKINKQSSTKNVAVRDILVPYALNMFIIIMIFIYFWINKRGSVYIPIITVSSVIFFLIKIVKMFINRVNNNTVKIIYNAFSSMIFYIYMIILVVIPFQYVLSIVYVPEYFSIAPKIDIIAEFFVIFPYLPSLIYNFLIKLNNNRSISKNNK
jgi:hypothetical protein